MTRLFIDMDGVLADFDGHYTKVFGETPEESDKEHKGKLWRNIKGYEGEFFAELPMLEDDAAKDLVHLAWTMQDEGDVEGSYILTAASDSQFAEVGKQKRKWLREHLGYWNLMVLTTRKGTDKAAFVQQPGDILIDDMEKNCVAWERAGGKAIRFRNVQQAVEELEGLVYDTHFIGR